MRQSKKRKNQRKDAFLRLTAVQLAAAVFIFLLLFLLIRKDGAAAVRIREEYSSMMAGDWDIAGWFRSDSRSVFTEQEDEAICIPAFGNDGRTEKEKGGSALILASAAPVETKKAAGALTDSFYEEDAPVIPVCGTVTSDYGNRIHPITGEESFHSGRDIAADEGTDILSVFDGVVTDTGVGELSGNYVKIDHGRGLTALYCHCSSVYVKTGDAVRKGDIIAAVGETGAATGPHLHFEIRRNGELTDPAAVLDQAIDVG